MLQSFLFKIKDHRRQQGRRYQLGHILLFSVLAILSNATSYDAINCQEKTLEVAKKTGNDVIVQVKGNQKTLFEDCQSMVSTLLPAEAYQEPTAKGHNRIECRSVELFTLPLFRDADKWHLVESVVKVERERWSFDTKNDCWKASHETSYYIATTILGAETFCQAIRNHWGIENSDHYVRDVALGRIRTNPHIFAKLGSFALNLLRANHVDNVSLELFRNCLNINNILNYVGIRQN